MFSSTSWTSFLNPKTHSDAREKTIPSPLTKTDPGVILSPSSEMTEKSTLRDPPEREARLVKGADGDAGENHLLIGPRAAR